jgi:hypothetical protein
VSAVSGSVAGTVRDGDDRGDGLRYAGRGAGLRIGVEVVVDDTTGIICATAEELPAAIAKAERLRPAACGAHVAHHFDLTLMAEGYERVYRQVAAR